jgi:hypothetical protein
VVAHPRKQSDTRSARRLNEPQRALVVTRGVGAAAEPVSVNKLGVAGIREVWRVADRWWTEAPVRRRYFDVVLESGQNAVVFQDEEGGGWFTQRGA